MKRLLPLLILCLTGYVSRASHAMGGEISYDYISGNTYKFQFSFYRDCAGIAAPTEVVLNYGSLSCGFSNLTDTLYPTIGSPQQLSPVCPTMITTCNGGTYVGIQKWVYERTITLPGQCTDWLFSYTICCRNAAITNISAPSSASEYFMATLNNSTVAFNNSVRFSNTPVPMIFAGHLNFINNGAYDADGDSISVTLTQPCSSSPTDTVTFVPGHSYGSPILSSPPMTISSLTGDLNVTPVAAEVDVMSYLVREYRNGVLVGSFNRDIQINITNYSNNLPDLSQINGNAGYIKSACAGDTITFDIYSTDADATQNTTITPLTNIPNFQYTNSGGSRDTLHVSIVTDSTMIAALPYQLQLVVEDDACPYNGVQIRNYTIYINGCSADVWPGDANGDLTCNIYDILPIGLAFNATGTTRAGASLAWTAQPSADWAQSLTSGINFKHADCNGDGLVDWLDTVAIPMNYGMSHPMRLSAPNAVVENHGIHLLLSDTIASPGFAMTVGVQLGETGHPATLVSGIAFRINFNPGLMDPVQSNFTFLSGQLGIPSNNLLVFSYGDWSAGFIDIAAVRVDHQQVSIDSLIGELHLVIASNATNQVCTFSVTNILAVDASGGTKTYLDNPQTVDVQTSTQVNNILNQQVSIYPSPAKSLLTISSHELISRINLQDEQGRLVLSSSEEKNTCQLNVASLPQGFYFAEIFSGNNIIRKKIFIQR